MPDSPESPKPEHDDNGHFAAGNKGGPGNPFARQVAALRKAILARLTVETAGEIADTLITRAKSGDVAAARLLFQYALGKPSKGVEPDRVEIEDHNLRLEATVPMTEMMQPLGCISVEKMNELSGIMRPITDQKMLEPLVIGVKEMGGGIPTKKQMKAAHRKSRRALRQLYRGTSPSPNGPDGDPIGASIVGGG
jgi:hypothetical protein